MKFGKLNINHEILFPPRHEVNKNGFIILHYLILSITASYLAPQTPLILSVL